MWAAPLPRQPSMSRIPVKRGTSLSQRIAAFASAHGAPWRRPLSSGAAQVPELACDRSAAACSHVCFSS